MKLIFHSFIILILLMLTSSCTTTSVLPKNEKIWLHRANRIEKAKLFQYTYPGLEIDIVFDDTTGTFLVKHEANEPSNTTLDQWCQAVDHCSELGIWFDFKNLNANNRDAALTCLQQLRQRHHLHGKLYVESPAYPHLELFQEAGFLVSYYIPDFNPCQDNGGLQHLATIQDAIDHGVDAISGSELQYEFMKKHFPNQTLLIWTINTDLEYQRKLIDSIANDSLVEVLLLPNTFLEN